MKRNKSNWRRFVTSSKLPKMFVLGALLLATSITSAQTLDVVLTPFEYNGSVNIRCNGTNTGRITATVTGGIPPYNYSWSAGVPVAGGTTAIGLFAGSCSLTVTDSVGTSVTETVVLVENSPLVASVSWTPIDCFGDSSTVTVSASGGTAPYNGTITAVVPAGPVAYTVSDANGCRVSVSEVITQPDLLEVTASATPIACFGETSDVTVTATGGTGPYVGTGVSAVLAGTNDFYVTDANGCSGMVQLTITQPGELVVLASNTPILCNGETSEVTVSVVSGTEPYSGAGLYIENAGTYTYDVFDFNMCHDQVTITITEPDELIVSATDGAAVPGSTDDIVVSAVGGTDPYTGIGTFAQGVGTQTYTVIDGNGCTASATSTVTALDPLEVSVLPTSCTTVYPGIGYNYSCGTIGVAATGGSQNYIYSWSTGDTGPSIVVCPTVTTTYTVTVTDGSGAVSTASWTINALDIICTGNGSSSSSSYSSSGLCGGSSSSSGVVNGCVLPNDSSAVCGMYLSSSSSSSSYGSITGKVMMCLNGYTECVSPEHISAKLKCGYILGACGMDQPCDVPQGEVQDSSILSCVCSGTLASINVRYIGPNGQTVNASAKDCGIPISDHANLDTGDEFTVAASSGGLTNLRNNTYLGLAGWNYGLVRVPTNCCENPIGNVFFPFQVIGWTDTDGNTCGVVNNGGGGGIDGMQTAIGQSGKESHLAQKTVTIKQYPNPAATSATFEFSVPRTETVSISIVGINGQLIETIASKEVVADQSYTVTYDVSELQSGIYFVHLASSEGVMKKKFVVLK